MLKLKKIFLLITLLYLSSCVSISKSGYYWGTYANTYYKSLKDPSEKNILAHKNNLEKIIEYSNERGLNVAPGLHAELAYMLREEDYNRAQALYSKELSLYPESKIFLERLQAKKK